MSWLFEQGVRRAYVEGGATLASAIVAAGSSPVALAMLPDDPRIVDSTGALELPFVPRRLLVIGGGIIGLEMATVYSALGARVDVVERLGEAELCTANVFPLYPIRNGSGHADAAVGGA